MKKRPSGFCWPIALILLCFLGNSVIGSDPILYPAPGQKHVPLWFPGNETPDPLPEAKNKIAGYPITVMFPRRSRVAAVTADLRDQDKQEVDVWLSTPEKPANPKHADSQQNTVCLIAKQPLRAGATYTVRVEVQLDGEPWSRTWNFTTLSHDEMNKQMAGTLLRTLNNLRRGTGLAPVSIDAEASKACAAHARYLGLNASANPMLSWNEEKPDLPGYSKAGATVAPTASIQGGGGPVEAVTGLIDSLISRPHVLDARLNGLGVGYEPFRFGGWIWVMDLLKKKRSSAKVNEVLYPAPDQKEIPLAYPTDEIPSPIPAESKRKEAGYAVTAIFPDGEEVTKGTAKLTDAKGGVVPAWFSTPQKPAIADYPQRALCLLPHKPLQPNTRYTASFQAEVDGRPWRRTWSFTTLRNPDRFTEDMEEKMLAQLNAVRREAGLPLVRLDAELSRGCRSHARYLARNAINPLTHGMAIHKEDASLPGATPEGARAANKAVIAVLLDPGTCLENWMATLYHRIPLLAPNLQRIGFGHARMEGRKWVCVLDTGNGRAR